MAPGLPFLDRAAAGRVLARRLADQAGRAGTIVLGLPRGGVPVAFEVARALGAPLDVFLVRKLGVPGQEEVALGAIASGGIQVLNDDVVSAIGISRAEIGELAAREGDAIARAERFYRHDQAPLLIPNANVIVVDDGLATGASMRAAARAVRARGPTRVTLAVPVGARETCLAIGEEADEVVCAETPEPFEAVGFWYQDFSQISDHDVRELLERARGRVS